MDKRYLINMSDFLELRIPELNVDISNHRVILSCDRTKVIINPLNEYHGDSIMTFDTYEDLVSWMYNEETKEEKNWNLEYIDS
jgi:hypothetical protein